MNHVHRKYCHSLFKFVYCFLVLRVLLKNNRMKCERFNDDTSYFGVIPEEFAFEVFHFAFDLSHETMFENYILYRWLINLVGRTIPGPNVNKCNQGFLEFLSKKEQVKFRRNIG